MMQPHEPFNLEKGGYDTRICVPIRGATLAKLGEIVLHAKKAGVEYGPFAGVLEDLSEVEAMRALSEAVGTAAMYGIVARPDEGTNRNLFDHAKREAMGREFDFYAIGPEGDASDGLVVRLAFPERLELPSQDLREQVDGCWFLENPPYRTVDVKESLLGPLELNLTRYFLGAE